MAFTPPLDTDPRCVIAFKKDTECADELLTKWTCMETTSLLPFDCAVLQRSQISVSTQRATFAFLPGPPTVFLAHAG